MEDTVALGPFLDSMVAYHQALPAAAKEAVAPAGPTLPASLAGLEGAACPQPCVPYYSLQNDCLRQELPMVAAMVPPCLPLTTESFGTEPDAVNLWIGDERSTTTTHKDHYENVRGCC